MSERENLDQELRLPEAVELGSLNVVLLILGFIGLLSSNPSESVFAIVQLKILLLSFWRKNTPPFVLLLFLIPWLEISAGIFEANVRGETLNQMLHGSGAKAYWLGAIGLCAVYLGFYPFFRRSPSQTTDFLKTAASSLSLPRLIIAYFLIGPLTDQVAGFIGRGSSLYQFVTYLNEISIVLLIIIAVRQVVLADINRLFIAFFVLATLLSFYSFFSEWRTIIYALFIAFGTTAVLSRKLIIRILVLGVLFGNVIFVWQAVKPYYRAYLSGQEGNIRSLQSQRVEVSRGEALAKFAELSGQFYSGELGEQIETITKENELLFSTLRRVGYLELFALTLNRVPGQIEHTEGNLTKSNLSFALIPRFLNPNKGVKNDGATVEEYAGFMVSDAASFSLGHYTEYFIDFGSSGMMLALLFFGIAGGLIYQIASKSRITGLNPLLFYALGFVVMEKWGSFQNDAIFVYGLTFFGALCHLFIFLPLYRIIIRFASLD